MCILLLAWHLTETTENIEKNINIFIYAINQGRRSTTLRDWDTKINDIILNEEYKFFDVKSEDFYEMSIDDQHIQIDLLNEMRKY